MENAVLCSNLDVRDRLVLCFAGMVATCASLVYGLTGLTGSNARRQNMGMRMRIGFQGLTIGALLLVGFVGGRNQLQTLKQKNEAARRAREESAALKANAARRTTANTSSA